MEAVSKPFDDSILAILAKSSELRTFKNGQTDQEKGF
jgi:hypothetical protein